MMTLNNGIESTIYSKNNGSISIKGLGNDTVKVVTKQGVQTVTLVLERKQLEALLALNTK